MERKEQKKSLSKLSDIDRKVILSYSENVPETVIKPAFENASYGKQIIKMH